MQDFNTHAPSRPTKPEVNLRWVSQLATLLALAAGLVALVGWWTENLWMKALHPNWPPLQPLSALGMALGALGLTFRWSRQSLPRTAASLLGGLIASLGLTGYLGELLGVSTSWQSNVSSWIAGTKSTIDPNASYAIDHATLILTGLGLMWNAQIRRAWLRPHVLVGSVLLLIGLFGIFTQVYTPGTVVPGNSIMGAGIAILLGLALGSGHGDSNALLNLRANNATGLVGRRLLLLTGILPPTLYLLQLSAGAGSTVAGLERCELITITFTFSLLAILLYTLQRLEQLDAEKAHTEQERDRLLQRVQHQAASLQQEVSNRTKELKLLNDRHRLALRSSNYGVWDWDVLNNEVVWDATMLHFFGIEPATFTGKLDDWLRRVHPDDLARLQQLDWEVLAPDDTLSFEYRILRPDGTIRFLRAQGQPQFSPDNRLIRIVGLARDHTLDREKESELESLNERLKFVISAAGYGVWEYDFKGDRLYWDEQLLKLHGLKHNDVSEGIKGWRQRVHPDDWTGIQQHLHEIIAGRIAQVEPEYRIILPDGSVRYMQMRSYLIRTADGTPVQLVGLNRDVTTGRELREQLRISEERWRLVIRSNNDAVWDWDLAKNHVYRDERYAEMLGMSAEELDKEGQDWIEMMHPEDRKQADEVLKQHLQNQSSYYQCEFRMRHKNGQWVWMLDRGKVVARDDNDQPLRMVGTQIDITTRKVLEEKLRHNEQLSLQLNRLAQIGAWEEDLPSNRFTWAPEIYRIHEVELGFVPNAESVRSFYPPESSSVLDEAFMKARQEGTPFDLELPFITARGNRLWIRVIGQAEMHAGKVTRLFGGFQDITARRDAEEMRRQLESQLFQAQKMETLGTLAGGIAHDFNNLLTGILGYQDLAFDGLPEGHESRPYLDASRDASLRARELVDQILTFSRQSVAKMLPLDLMAIAEGARRFLRATVPATIRIELQGPGDCPPVMADESQLHQVLLNLGTNAAHAMQQCGGMMRIALSPITVEESRSFNQLAPGRYVRVDFSDTGCGMDESTCKRIFDPFFTTKDVGKGTGLGLSMVHGIIQAHHGHITVESVVGKGTTFTFFIPVAEIQESVIPQRQASTPRGNGELVAIVDDEDLVRSFAQISLERAGYRVLSFDRATTCLEQIRDHIGDFSLLLTDQTMPGMSGIELASEIRSIAPTLPVIVMSGYYSRIAPEMLQQMGFVSLISKPFTNEELAQAVSRSIIESRSQA